MHDKRDGKRNERNGRPNWVRFKVLTGERTKNIVLKVY
jgi:hypothetical protein